MLEYYNYRNEMENIDNTDVFISTNHCNNTTAKTNFRSSPLCVLSGGTQRRTLPHHHSEEMNI